MKKNVIFASALLIFSLCIMVSCSSNSYDPSNQKPSENLDILTSGTWQYDFEGCGYTLRLYDNGEFSNYCNCGSPVGDSDLAEYYIYNDDEKKLYLYDSDGKQITEGNIESISRDTLIIKLFGETCEYKLVLGE